MFDTTKIQPLSVEWIDGQIADCKKHPHTTIRLAPGSLIKVLANAQRATGEAKPILKGWIADAIDRCNGNPYQEISLLPKPYIELLKRAREASNGSI
jgi:hypothetical protein